jgi:hypothetical protein
MEKNRIVDGRGWSETTLCAVATGTTGRKNFHRIQFVRIGQFTIALVRFARHPVIERDAVFHIRTGRRTAATEWQE